MSIPTDNDPKAAVELLEPADYGQYLLHAPGEIEFLLRQLQERKSQITLFFNEGADLMLTMLLAVSRDGIIIDVGAIRDVNERVSRANRLFCVTTLDKVKVQFILTGLSPLTYQGQPAFRAALPDSVLRLQRREFFRLTLPTTRRLHCLIPLADDQIIDAEVLDLSGGGLAMVVPPDRQRFEPGMEFPDCRMELPEIGVVVATVRVQTAFELTLKSGTHVKRAGCKFVDMPGTMGTLIQRFIIKMERERKAQENGLL